MLNLDLELTKELLNSVNVGFYISQDNRFKFVNREISRITGYSEEELLSTSPYELLAEDEEKERMKNFTRLALLSKFDGLPYEHEVKIVRKDGSIGWVVLRPLPAIYKGRRAIICSVFDITDTKSEELKKEELENFLNLVNKIIRHDLINKLSAAISYLDLFFELNDDRLVEKALKSLEKSVETLRRMRDLEQLAKSGMEKRILSLKDVFENVASHYDIEVVVKGDCSVVADDGIYSIADNLIGNSVKHGRCNRVEVTIAESDGKCEIRVADDGVGIEENVRDSIFDEGFSQGGGTGLGLFIVRKLVEKYGGEIEVENNEPRGAVFRITLLAFSK